MDASRTKRNQESHGAKCEEQTIGKGKEIRGTSQVEKIPVVKI